MILYIWKIVFGFSGTYEDWRPNIQQQKWSAYSIWL